MKYWCGCLVAFVITANAQQPELKNSGEKDKLFVNTELNNRFTELREVARSIWSFAERGFLEEKSTALLQDVLQKEGFQIEKGVAGMPTAFVASYGSGKPVIGILAEFDALPGLSQDSVPHVQPIKTGGAGHGCGHNLFGSASASAAIALKEWLIKNKREGTVRLFGTPAEEGGSAKVYMVREALFDDVDAVLHWYPSSENQASPESCLAIMQATFRFYGRSAHSAAAPHVGRSALDGVESMNYMVNLMREHIPQESRIHYVISKGGLAPNVVPDYAEVEYMVRHPDARTVQQLFDRIVRCAQGAATGTETRMEVEIISGSYNLLPNEPLARLMQKNLERVGGVKYTPEEMAFAQKIQATFTYAAPDLADAAKVQPYQTGGFFPASTDVGDVSWVVPTVGLGVATWVPGTVAHSWQAVACDGMSIGFKGMLNASKVMAMTGVDLFNNPAMLEKAKAELNRLRGNDFTYKALLGDRKPSLDYRKGR